MNTKRENYKEHLKDVILAVFTAENKIQTAEIKQKLGDKTMDAHEYLDMIAEEILSHTPEELYADFEEDTSDTCGNCVSLQCEDVEGYGWCKENNCGTHCSRHCKKWKRR